MSSLTVKYEKSEIRAVPYLEKKFIWIEKVLVKLGGVKERGE